MNITTMSKLTLTNYNKIDNEYNTLNTLLASYYTTISKNLFFFL